MQTRQREVIRSIQKASSQVYACALPWFGNMNAGEWGKGVFQTELGLSSPPWCTPHHHPGSLRLSSGFWQRTAHLYLFSQPASPERRQPKVILFSSHWFSVFTMKQHLSPNAPCQSCLCPEPWWSWSLRASPGPDCHCYRTCIQKRRKTNRWASLDPLLPSGGRRNCWERVRLRANSK